MTEFEDGVVVVTGAASGIGLGMARAFAHEGMRLVMADIEPAALAVAAEELRSGGAEVVAECVDVSDGGAVEQLAQRVYGRFGQVAILCNNAGVIENNLAAWEYSLDDWNWVLGINLMGVVHGIRAFIPRMLAGGQVGHVVNTASFGGLISGTANPIYTVSKHAVVALSENLYNDLTLRDEKIKVSVLCPGWVRTKIADSDRNRDLGSMLTDKMKRARQRFQSGINTGMEADAVGMLVVDAVRAERFYIHTHPEWMDIVRDRFDAIVDGNCPAISRIPNSKK
tara:strand:+ start:231 stop:1076 length:846 start_codon:yes stop_codon:yes gene_type:complete